jgi:hypothetical protein
MGNQKSPNRRFELAEHSSSNDSYMYSETRTEWSVVSTETGDELASFSGWNDDGLNGPDRGGTSSVSFEGSAFVVARRHEGEPERVELPAKVALADGGRAIELTFRDGRTERRERRRGLFISKYGDPCVVRELVGLPRSEGEPEPEKKPAARKPRAKKSKK